MTARRALVTGAAGGIGTAVVKELTNRGMRVVGLDRDVRDLPEVIECDVTDSDSVATAVARAAASPS